MNICSFCTKRVLHVVVVFLFVDIGVLWVLDSTAERNISVSAVMTTALDLVSGLLTG